MASFAVLLATSVAVVVWGAIVLADESTLRPGAALIGLVLLSVARIGR